MTGLKKIIKIIAFLCLIYCNKYVLVDIFNIYVKNIELTDIYDMIIKYMDVISIIISIYLIIIYNC